MELTRLAVLSLAPAAAGLALLGAACSQDPGLPPPPACDTVDDSCPATQPTFARDAFPVVQKYCNGCHGEGGIEQALYDYSSYPGVARARSSIATFVSDCRMPPADAGLFPDDQERQVLLQWIACGAQNN